MASGFGAGAGADMLQEILRQKFSEAMQQQAMQQRTRSLDLDQQRINNETAIRNATLQSQDEERKARMQEIADKRGVMAANAMTPNTVLDPNSPAVRILRASVLAPTLQQDKTLDSTNLSGAVGGPLARVANPGQATGNVRFMGTPQQNTDLEQRAARERFIAANPKLADAASMLDPDKAAGFLTEYAKEQAKGNAPPKTEAVYRQNPRTGTIDQVGEVPTGSHFMTEPPPRDTSAADANRTQNSYQYHATALEKLRKPAEDTAAKIGELSDLLAQGTPQADALVAPKLLSTIVGGQGSGLRMNEAEISRVLGGRSKWESLKAAAQQWSLNPATANSITPEQRGQIRAIVSATAEKNRAALKTLDDAGDALASATDPTQHRQILNGAHKALTALSTGGAGPTTASGKETPEQRIARLLGKK